MNPGELEILCHLFREVNPVTVIEFGVNTGRTAKALLREVPTIQKYIGIDVAPGYITPMKVQRREVPAVPGELVAGDSRVEVIIRPQGSHQLTEHDLPRADAIFIDGDHSRRGVEWDTMLATIVIRRGGVIVWHDYHDQGTVEVRDVLDELYVKGRDIHHIAGTWLAFERIK